MCQVLQPDEEGDTQLFTVNTYLRSKFEDTRRKALKYGAQRRR